MPKCNTRTNDLILDLAYVGQHSTNLRSNFDAVNSLSPKYFSQGANLLTQIGAQTAVAPPYAGFPSTAIVAQALVPFPQYFGFNTDGALENLGQSTYNALEAQLTRRFRNGLNLMASYTWSKTLTDATLRYRSLPPCTKVGLRKTLSTRLATKPSVTRTSPRILCSATSTSCRLARIRNSCRMKAWWIGSLEDGRSAASNVTKAANRLLSVALRVCHFRRVHTLRPDTR